MEYCPRFIGRQQLAVNQQGLGAHQGGEHCLGIGQFGVAADQVATADQAVCHRFEAALAGKLHVGIHQAAKGLLAQLRLPPLPAFLQGLEGCGIGQEPLAQAIDLMQQGPQQVTAALATEAVEGQQLATVIAQLPLGAGFEALANGAPYSIRTALLQGDRQHRLARLRSWGRG